MDDVKLKEAFSKVRKDILDLREEINKLKEGFFLINQHISEDKTHTQHQTQTPQNQTDSTHIPTQNTHFEALKHQNIPISTGNAGVPTDRQTNRQTNRHIEFEGKNEDLLDDTLKILDSLDSAKKEIRLRFKRLTDMEFLVFSTLYQLEEEVELNEGIVTYSTIALKLGLTESSIRDYIGKLIKKEIPVEKIKVNNKSISLKVSKNLKKIASLPTILQLRDL